MPPRAAWRGRIIHQDTGCDLRIAGNSSRTAGSRSSRAQTARPGRPAGSLRGAGNPTAAGAADARVQGCRRPRPGLPATTSPLASSGNGVVPLPILRAWPIAPAAQPAMTGHAAMQGPQSSSSPSPSNTLGSGPGAGTAVNRRSPARFTGSPSNTNLCAEVSDARPLPPTQLLAGPPTTLGAT